MEAFPWHPVQKRRQVFLAAFAVLCIAGWWLTPGDMERQLALWALVIPALGTVNAVAEVDADGLRLVRRWRVFGVIPLFRREFPLGDFRAVTLRGIRDPQPGDPVYLVLTRKDGRFMKITCFSGSALRDGSAEAAVERLARAAGLPVADYPASGYTIPICTRG
ncbi:hypothetical protein OKA04_13105 [Luteolibacter flavescens]|uniref:Uncharacterized protein n=1 Tax=Luteolibacter flavescens TaxID=1859460 RepID=A0ABT3FQ13_9BACT|nr:hypothetical protein [Luteolibacter flavescens]MCW1885671.1 hypothetical protein [Luteolibacter flavescens]